MRQFIVPVITNRSLLPVYLYSVGGMENQIPIHRQHGYTEFIWLHTIQGKGRLLLDAAEYVLEPNMGMLIYPGVAHKYHSLEEPWETHWIAFHGFGIRPLLQKLLMTKSKVYRLQNAQLLERHIHDIFTAACSKHHDIGLNTTGKLYNFLLDLPSCVVDERTPANTAAYSLLNQVQEYMEQHYDRNISLSEMAGAAGISHQYLCRIFKQTMQMTPTAYLTKLRLQKAKELLLERDVTITQAGRSVGFWDTSYFCAVFKQHEGITPLDYKRNYR
ncbi:AraC family transcriptional regulator [Paenibacillus sp. GD4]|uniref:helix-turn-helix transcriptional regulator n=1 Tax=Paenibacillus sp. GD4 TaxID=3068890 RepID=UPI0027964CC7|nr:AraC family transcriptional regulator [Paenibacillus sp. GD4]MDQ1909054.1 AraC family transcriptional regulator [Paenibacillus sp. GD4]